jgi:hypothetical protein
MARVRIILNKQYESKDGYQIVYKIANRGTHSHLSSGITIPEKYWDEKKLIKRNAPGIQDNSYTNAQLNKDLSEIQAFITSLTSSKQIYDLTASQIKERYLKEKTNNSYDFNTYFDYYLETRKATIASKLDIPKETISAALGHEIGSDTTAIYIEYDMNKVDQANRKVIGSLSF